MFRSLSVDLDQTFYYNNTLFCSGSKKQREEEEVICLLNRFLSQDLIAAFFLDTLFSVSMQMCCNSTCRSSLDLVYVVLPLPSM